jgi:hypothetical protein
MKKFSKMTTSGLSRIEVSMNIDFTSSVKMDNVKIGKGGGGRESA